jgi:hypothetical protein
VKPTFYPEAFAYCVVWVALAIYGLDRAGVAAGLILSIGLFPIIMGSSLLILTKTGNFAAEQAVRWGLLAVAGIVLLSYLDIIH